MFSFSTFGIPIIFAGVFLISMTVGVTCIWDMWRRDAIVPLSEKDSEIPRLWDFFIEDPVGSKYGDVTWAKILPFSVTRIRTESHLRPAKTNNIPPTTLRHKRTANDPEVGNSTPQEYLQIAVVIAMPCAHRLRNASEKAHNEPPVCCIGLNEA
ncbi:hypothetical protein B0H19DRAFT_123370 [Mycena capillaripes]|nr:hypothetical protein B0H19DRAFT_123370 [Mycena capillaripes]